MYSKGLTLVVLLLLQGCLRGELDGLVAAAEPAAAVAVAPPEDPSLQEAPVPAAAAEPAAPPRDGRSLPTASPADCGVSGPSLPSTARLHALNDPALGSLCYVVLLPAGGIRASAELPMLVFLHGLGAGPTNILQGGHLLAAVESARASGDWPESIIVLPTGRDGYWTDHLDGHQPWGSAVLAMVDAVRGGYPVLPDAGHTVIAGVSMGGFGALSLGLQHPERFGVVAGVSATDLARAVAEQPARDVYAAVVGNPADPQRLAAINPRHLVEAGKGGSQRFVLVWGDKEPPRFAAGSRDLVAAMKAHEVPVVTRIVPGGNHEWSTTWTLETMVWWLREAGKAMNTKQP